MEVLQAWEAWLKIGALVSLIYALLLAAEFIASERDE